MASSKALPSPTGPTRRVAGRGYLVGLLDRYYSIGLESPKVADRGRL